MLSSTKVVLRAVRGVRHLRGCVASSRGSVKQVRSVSHLISSSGNPISPQADLVNNFPTTYHQPQFRSIFIQSEETPNPESIKFIPTGHPVLMDGDVNGYYVTKTDPQDSILRSPLAKELFKIDGLKAVYLGADFVTITKFAQGNWKLLRPEILDVLMNFFDGETPALLDAPEITDTTILDDDDEVVAMIKELIESRIRPAVQEDGGDIRYVSFEEETGLVTVELAGSCVGCPSSSVTLKQGVENMLQHYIPEVTAVVALEEEQDGEEEEVTVEQNKTKIIRREAKGGRHPF